MPEVSVIVPNYNHAAFLSQRMDSIVQQSFSDFEVIILDDASTDNSRDIIETYKSDPKVSQVIFNEKNSGSSFAQWNKGVALATGKYIWIAESDDFSDLQFLETALQRLKHGDVDLVYANSFMVDDKSQITGNLDWWYNDLSTDLWKSDFKMEGNDFRARFLSIKNAIMNASSVLFIREHYLAVGMANTNMKLCGDWEFWARYLVDCKLAFITSPLNYYRFHSQTVRDKPNNSKVVYDESLRVRMQIVNECHPSESVVAHSARETMKNLKAWAIARGKILGGLVLSFEIFKIMVKCPALGRKMFFQIINEVGNHRK